MLLIFFKCVVLLNFLFVCHRNKSNSTIERRRKMLLNFNFNGNYTEIHIAFLHIIYYGIFYGKKIHCFYRSSAVLNSSNCVSRFQIDSITVLDWCIVLCSPFNELSALSNFPNRCGMKRNEMFFTSRLFGDFSLSKKSLKLFSETVTRFKVI